MLPEYILHVVSAPGTEDEDGSGYLPPTERWQRVGAEQPLLLSLVMSRDAGIGVANSRTPKVRYKPDTNATQLSQPPSCLRRRSTPS